MFIKKKDYLKLLNNIKLLESYLKNVESVNQKTFDKIFKDFKDGCSQVLKLEEEVQDLKTIIKYGDGISIKYKKNNIKIIFNNASELKSNSILIDVGDNEFTHYTLTHYRYLGNDTYSFYGNVNNSLTLFTNPWYDEIKETKEIISITIDLKTKKCVKKISTIRKSLFEEILKDYKEIENKPILKNK